MTLGLRMSADAAGQANAGIETARLGVHGDHGHVQAGCVEPVLRADTGCFIQYPVDAFAYSGRKHIQGLDDNAKRRRRHKWVLSPPLWGQVNRQIDSWEMTGNSVFGSGEPKVCGNRRKGNLPAGAGLHHETMGSVSGAPGPGRR